MQKKMVIAWVVTLMWLMSGCWAQGPPPSPCPDIFSYQYDSSGGWYGVVTILSPSTFSQARLVLKMTIANYDLSKGYGRIEVLGGNPEVQEVSKSAHHGRRHRIQFMVIFPPISTIPRVKEVLVNEVTFCADHRDYGAGASINLNYALNTGLEVPPVSGSEFSVVPSSGIQGQHSGTYTNFRPKDKVHPTVTAPQGSYGSELPYSPNTNGGQLVYYPGVIDPKLIAHHKVTAVQQEGFILNGNANNNGQNNVHYPSTSSVSDTQYPVSSVGSGGYYNGQNIVNQQTKPFTHHKNTAVQHDSHISNGNSNTNVHKNLPYSTTAPTLNNVNQPVGSVGGVNNNNQNVFTSSSSEADRKETEADDSSQAEKQKKKVVFRFETFEDDIVKQATFQVGNTNGTSRNFTIHFEESE